MLLLLEDNPKVTREVAEEKFTRIVKMEGQENLFRVEMTIVDPETGTYVPVFRSGSLDVFGPKLRITVLFEMDKSHRALIAMSCFLVVVGIFVFLVYIRRRTAKKVKEKRE